MMPARPAKPKRAARAPRAVRDAGPPRLSAARRRQLAALQRDLRALHDDWKAALSQHEVRTEAQFKALARRLEPATEAAVEQAPSPKQAERMVAALDGVRIKPKKGRGKDLRLVEHTLGRVLRSLPDGE